MDNSGDYILMIGCFDTKAEVFGYLYKCLKSHGKNIITINTGIMGSTDVFPVDFESETLANYAGSNIIELRQKADRNFAMEKIGQGAAILVSRLVAQGGLKGAIGMGGGGGTFIILTAMQQIPIGIPKICISTLVGKDLSNQLGRKDILLMPSIVDVAGINSISSLLISQAAAAISAMLTVSEKKSKKAIGKIAISMFGNTTPCVDMCTKFLEEKGYEVFAFHANGLGGLTMESLIRENFFQAVLDITTTELADDLFGGSASAGPKRLMAAVEMGIPQVVVPGCLDMVNFGPINLVPTKYKTRKLYSWGPDSTLMRTNKNENRILAKELIRKLNKSTAVTSVLLPLKGISQIDSEGNIFFHPEIDQVLFETIKRYAAESVQILEVDAHINSIFFAETAVKTLLINLKKQTNLNYAKSMDR
ncbi:Tm-1-like ATP-binding domain-containing protein [Anditalea andensis]|uniref:Transcriptional regulator n=1 Tax=Anditalea andensis TaxID=1048983 RepID=A0A074L0A7_9BACT|nr:Tm-1-like ATP-binding domain-containing protein [Anditalea andensis]KEO75646.1 transcriptional regulator [Anditalea andensis]